MNTRSTPWRRTSCSFLVAAVCCLGSPRVRAEITVTALGGAHEFFGGGDSNQLEVVLRNSGDVEMKPELRVKLSQLSASTALPLGVTPWKSVRILAGQRLLEWMPLELPNVKARTVFLAQWLDGIGKVLGKARVTAYPTNLLAELSTLAGTEPLGLWDPESRLRPVLKVHGVQFADLQEGIESFSGKLALVFPARAAGDPPVFSAEALKTLAGRVGAIVLIETVEPNPVLLASFRVVSLNKARVVIAQKHVLEGISQQPRPQLNLLELARMAVQPASENRTSALIEDDYER